MSPDHKARDVVFQARITSLEENEILMQDIARVRDEVQFLVEDSAKARRRLVRARHGNRIRDIVMSYLIACAGGFGMVFWVQTPEPNYVQRR